MNFLKINVISHYTTVYPIKKEEALINLDAINFITSSHKHGNEIFYNVAFNHGSSILIDKETYEVLSNKIVQVTLTN